MLEQKSQLTSTSQVIHQQFCASRLELAYLIFPVALILSFASSLVVLIWLRAMTHLPALLLWMTLSLSICVAGMGLFFAYRRTDKLLSVSNYRKWEWRLGTLTALLGLSWGALPWVTAHFAAAIMQVYVVSVFAIMSLGMTGSLLLSRLAFYGFYLPAIVPFLAYLFWGAPQEVIPIGWFTTLFLLILPILHDILHRALTNIIHQHSQSDVLAHHDSLTGLPNRRLFDDRLNNAIMLARRNKKKLAVMLLDLDAFKIINDTQGHNAGDEVLSMVAQRLKKGVRGSDTVARVGGDEFVVLLPEINNDSDVTVVADKLIALVQRPVTVGNHQYYLGISAGISFYPDSSDEASHLMHLADTAMYAAKGKGGSRWSIAADKNDK